MKRILKYRNLLYVLVMVASGGNFLHAQGMEEKAVGEASYGFDTETNKSSIDTNGVNKKDVKKAGKQARKEEREKRRQARRQESNGDYWGNSGYYPYGYRRSYFYGYGYPYRYRSSYRYRHYYRYRHHHGRHHHKG